MKAKVLVENKVNRGKGKGLEITNQFIAYFNDYDVPSCYYVKQYVGKVETISFFCPNFTYASQKYAELQQFYAF